MKEEPGIAFRDLPTQCFPFHMVAYNADTGEPLHWHHIPGPGAIRIPGKPEGVREVSIYMRWPDGTEMDGVS